MISKIGCAKGLVLQSNRMRVIYETVPFTNK